MIASVPAIAYGSQSTVSVISVLNKFSDFNVLSTVQDPIKKRLFLDGFTAMDSVALGGHRWGGGSTGVCYLDLHSTQTFSLCVSDGASQQLGGCLRDFRNKPFPVRVRVEYYQQALTVSCQFYLCGVLQASPLSVLPVWSATSKPSP